LRVLTWGLGGVGLIGCHVVLALLSPRFIYGSPMSARPIWPAVALHMLCGVLYLGVVLRIRRTPPSRRLMLWVLLVGAAMRVTMLLSAPMLEDDFYRYLWDGAVVAHGMNPYAHAPEQAGAETARPRLRALTSEAGLVLERVNHPHLRTIYPPVAQAAFAVAHWLKPWSLTAWRLVVLTSDVATLVLVVGLLRALGLPLLWLAVYWWNPVVVKEFANTAHMDAVVLPFVLGAILLTIRRRHVTAAAALAGATAAKIWPVLLLPVLLRPILTRPGRLAASLATFGLLGAALLAPMVLAGLGTDSGMVAYGRMWEMNDTLFMVFVWLSRGALRLFGGNLQHAQMLARGAVVAILAAWILWTLRSPIGNPADLCRRCLLVIAALFLLSPTQFPWYYVWLVPLLALQPVASLLALTVLLPLYYLRFSCAGAGNVGLFDHGIVWLEFAPVWALLTWEWYRAHRGHSPWLSEVNR